MIAYIGNCNIDAAMTPNVVGGEKRSAWLLTDSGKDCTDFEHLRQHQC
jgi:hypothetical protein